MRICDLTTGPGQLQRASTHLKEVWAETKEEWSDASRKQFQEKHLAPLAPQITLTVAAIHRSAETVRKAEKDLSDEADDHGF